MNLQEFIQKVKATTGHEPRKSGDNYMARCPAHDDRQASLSVGLGDDGKILLRCHAGCSAAQVVGALGLKLSDLMPQQNNGHARPAATPKAGPRAKTIHPTLDAAIAAALWGARQDDPGATLGAVWTYQDIDGNAVAAIARINLPTPANQKQKKLFRPVRREAAGWATGDPVGLWPLYRLPSLAGANAVHVGEGEKSANSLAGMGFIATTSAHGAKSAGKSDWKMLAGKIIYLWVDNDAAGEAYIADVARILLPLGCKLFVIRLPGLPEHGDICDYLEAIPDTESWELTKADLDKLVAAAPEYVPPPEAAPAGPTPRERAALICAADIVSEPIRWFWPDVFALKTVAILIGDPGQGKSTLGIDLAARASKGEPMPCTTTGGEIGSVLILTAEDSLSMTAKPRLESAGAELSKIHFLTLQRGRFSKNVAHGGLRYTLK